MLQRGNAAPRRSSVTKLSLTLFRVDLMLVGGVVQKVFTYFGAAPLERHRMRSHAGAWER